MVPHEEPLVYKVVFIYDFRYVTVKWSSCNSIAAKDSAFYLKFSVWMAPPISLAVDKNYLRKTIHCELIFEYYVAF